MGQQQPGCRPGSCSRLACEKDEVLIPFSPGAWASVSRGYRHRQGSLQKRPRKAEPAVFRPKARPVQLFSLYF